MEKTSSEVKFTVSAPPHIRADTSVPRIMYSVLASLVPATAGAVYFFGPRVLWVILIALASALGTEAAVQKLFGRPITVTDGSAAVTGVLLAFVLPPGVPLWIPAVGSVFAIFIGKQVFGGLGQNPLNPALVGRAFLMASWPVHMTTDWLAPLGGTKSAIDAVTRATPLNLLKESHRVLADPTATPAQLARAKQVLMQLHSAATHWHLFWGRCGGCLGETSVVLLLAGACFLLYKGYIGWRIPFSFVGTVFVLSWTLGGVDGLFSGDPLFHIFSGGLILGAFFMATDMVTTPVTQRGKLIFGTGCGAITVLIRLQGGYPEGVCYSILLMNAFTPLIDRWTRPTRFGAKQ